MKIFIAEQRRNQRKILGGKATFGNDHDVIDAQ